ncbi:HAD hydrolase-like protein [Nanoarchaeota archaeon]
MIIFDLDDTLYDKTGQLSDDLRELNEIKLFSGVKEILGETEIKKVLVTCGDVVLQRRKLEILGINNSFDNVFICPNNEDKEETFKFIVNKYNTTNYNIDKSRIFVVGNRIDSEIKYGNKLGLKTILLKHGKYKNLECKDNLEIPDYEINKIDEMGDLIKCKQ